MSMVTSAVVVAGLLAPAVPRRGRRVGGGVPRRPQHPAAGAVRHDHGADAARSSQATPRTASHETARTRHRNFADQLEMYDALTTTTSPGQLDRAAADEVLQGRAARRRRRRRRQHRDAQARRDDRARHVRRAHIDRRDVRGRRVRRGLRQHRGPDVPHGRAAAHRRGADGGVRRRRPTANIDDGPGAAAHRALHPRARPPRRSTSVAQALRRRGRSGCSTALDAMHRRHQRRAGRELLPRAGRLPGAARPKCPAEYAALQKEPDALHPRRHRLRRLARRRHLRQGRRRRVRQRALVSSSSRRSTATRRRARSSTTCARRTTPRRRRPARHAAVRRRRRSTRRSPASRCPTSTARPRPAPAPTPARLPIAAREPARRRRAAGVSASSTGRSARSTSASMPARHEQRAARRRQALRRRPPDASSSGRRPATTRRSCSSSRTCRARASGPRRVLRRHQPRRRARPRRRLRVVGDQRRQRHRRHRRRAALQRRRRQRRPCSPTAYLVGEQVHADGAVHARGDGDARTPRRPAPPQTAQVPGAAHAATASCSCARRSSGKPVAIVTAAQRRTATRSTPSLGFARLQRPRLRARRGDVPARPSARSTTRSTGSTPTTSDIALLTRRGCCRTAPTGVDGRPAALGRHGVRLARAGSPFDAHAAADQPAVGLPGLVEQQAGAAASAPRTTSWGYGPVYRWLASPRRAEGARGEGRGDDRGTARRRDAGCGHGRLPGDLHAAARCST